MELKEFKKGNFLVINLFGRLDTSNSGELEKKIIEFIDGGEKEIVVNFSDLVSERKPHNNLIVNNILLINSNKFCRK